MITRLFESVDDVEDINDYILIDDPSQIFDKLEISKNDRDENEDEEKKEEEEKEEEKKEEEKKEEEKKEEDKKEEEKKEAENEINVEFNYGRFRDVDMDSSSKSSCLEEESTFWTLENILLSKELLSIVKNKKILAELSKNISSI